MSQTPSRSQYQPLINPSDEQEIQANTWQSTRYREHVKYSRNPDQFYTDIYEYHQAGGFWSLLLAEVLWTVKFIFVIFIGVELTVCTRWNVLTDRTATVTQWSDVFLPPGQCWASLPFFPSLLVAGTVIAFLIHLIVTIGRLRRFWETRLFCTYILDMPTSSTGIGDMTWSEVQKRVIASHAQGSMDELSICHRIVRHVNYMIAMIDQEVLPVRFKFVSKESALTHVYLPDGYLFNLQLLLFRTPWSPFSGHWILKKEYKELSRRHDLALHLAKMSRIFGVLNLLFAPIILLFQFLVFICSNAERIRYHPSSIVGRRWSNYASFYLRHYNELRHQFLVRIGLAYEPACQYLDCFASRNMIALAETGAFVLGSASVAFFLLGLVQEQVFHLSGYWAILVFGGLLARACLSYIPEESSVRSPRALLVSILGKIHHFRDYWIEQSETSRVCAEFSQLFQYRLSATIEELMSSVLTPIILIFVLPDYTLKIVDFLRNYTVELKDLGDVCSFAQLDVRRHGDPNWKFSDGSEDDEQHVDVDSAKSVEHSPVLACTGGKTELSLMHFHLNNPNCTLPPASLAYLKSIQAQLLCDMAQPVQPSLDPSAQRQFVEAGPLATAPMFSSLYGLQNPPHTTDQAIATAVSHFVSTEFSNTGPLKNASQLPGPSHIDSKTLGFVGAMAESMRRSMQRSDPGMTRSTASDSTILKPRGTTSGAAADANEAYMQPPAFASVDPGLADSMMPPFSHLSQPRGMDTLNSGVLASSTQFGANVSGYPAYRPYVSQIDNGSSQTWGFGTSSALGTSINKHGLTELLMADTSASILYMHELAHRRRLQQQSADQSSVAVRLMGRSYLAGVSESTHGLGAYQPYQLPQMASPSVRILGGRSSIYTAKTSNERTYSSIGYGATASGEAVAVIRATSDRGLVSKPAVAKVTEEDEGNPVSRGTPESAFRAVVATGESVRSPAPYGSPSVPHRISHGSLVTSESHEMDTGLNEETDTEHVWPDLPPTNC